MDQQDVARVVRRVRWIMETAPRGTVITVAADGYVTTTGQRPARHGWKPPKRPLTAFIVRRPPLPPMEIWERIEEALELIDT